LDRVGANRSMLGHATRTNLMTFQNRRNRKRETPLIGYAIHVENIHETALLRIQLHRSVKRQTSWACYLL